MNFAREIGALSIPEDEALWHRGWTALGEAAAAQAEHVGSAEPARRFLELLASAIASGRAHVTADYGQEPANAATWGWRWRTLSGGDGLWEAQGMRIGWIVNGDLLLQPDTAYQAAQRAATMDSLTIQPRTLWRRLKERGHLARTEEPRKRNTIRVTLDGSRREVLHLRTEALLLPEPSQPSQPSHCREKAPGSGTLAWDSPEHQKPELSQVTVPEPPMDTGCSPSGGTVGTVGTVPGTIDPDDEWADA